MNGHSGATVPLTVVKTVSGIDIRYVTTHRHNTEVGIASGIHLRGRRAPPAVLVQVRIMGIIYLSS